MSTVRRIFARPQRLMALLTGLLVTPFAAAQPTARQFLQQHQAELHHRFGNVVSDAQLTRLLEQIIDQHHLEVDYNQYFRPKLTPLAHAAATQLGSVQVAKQRLVYPLLRYVLPRITPRPGEARPNAARPERARQTFGDRMAAQAYAYLGVPYGPPTLNRRTGQGTIDCSGLVNYVLRDLGATYRGGQAVRGIASSPDFAVVTGAPQPGDLLVRRHGNGPFAHVGIYAGHGQLIEAPYSGTVVRLTDYKPHKWHRILRYRKE